MDGKVIYIKKHSSVFDGCKAFFSLAARLYIVSYIPAYLIAVVLYVVLVVFSHEGVYSGYADVRFDGVDIISGTILIGVVNPFIETVIMAVLVRLGLMIKINRMAISMLVSLVFFGMHSYLDIYIGIVQIWPFFFQCYIYISHRGWKGGSAVFTAHSFNNLILFYCLLAVS